MWACKNEGEDARLYAAVKAVRILQSNCQYSNRKRLLSMKQNIQMKVIAPGTVIISGRKCMLKVVEPVLQRDGGSIYYINLSQMNTN
jgi:phosphoribosylformylglycinamidine synthase